MSEKSRALGVEFLDQEEVVVSQQTTVSCVIVVYNTVNTKQCRVYTASQYINDKSSIE